MAQVVNFSRERQGFADPTQLMQMTADAGLILGLHPANERRRYKVTPSLTGWAQAKKQPCDDDARNEGFISHGIGIAITIYSGFSNSRIIHSS